MYFDLKIQKDNKMYRGTTILKVPSYELASVDSCKEVLPFFHANLSTCKCAKFDNFS